MDGRNRFGKNNSKADIQEQTVLKGAINNNIKKIIIIANEQATEVAFSS